ncbi:hypothetical protein IID27_02905 [Patescibacteria group bacterium]|nr:hypothetical protein [Patescibacteria group bacterium]
MRNHKPTPKEKGRSIFRATGQTLIVSAMILALLSVAYFVIPSVVTTVYEGSATAGLSEDEVTKDTPLRVVHLPTPQPLRAIYMTQCVVGTPSFRDELVSLIESSELNSVIIDVKDYTGKIGFSTDNPILSGSVSDECGAADMQEFIASLHDKGIYTIARITVFQDPFYTSVRPDLAVKKESDGSVWKDYKGLSFVDVGARPFWDYIIELSKETHALGFDELNFDYIRFPSDGPMDDIYFPQSGATILGNTRYGKADALEQFFIYLHDNLKNPEVYSGDTAPVLSADVFGMTTTNTDDLNIGQVLERTLPYFDYVSPMVYPSHYPNGFNNWANPNLFPYEVVKFSMESAVRRAAATSTTVKTLRNKLISTTTPLYAKESFDILKLRPWLQDFDYGGDYDIAEVRAQIQATYDAGLDSWMLWAPSNRYTKGALEPYWSYNNE